MYKLVAIDIDDTLLTDDHRITEGTKQALKRASERGVLVTLATGRMHVSAKAIAAQLDMNVPLISYQGALVRNLLDDSILYERYLSQPIAERVFAYAAEHGLHLQAYYDDRLIVPADNDKVRAYAKLSSIPYTVDPDFAKYAALPMTKLLIIDEPAVLDEHIPVLKRQFGADAHITKSKPNFLEFMHPEGTKGNALRFLAEHHCGCTLAETIGIGDSWNDLDLVRMAGLGVAMGNAVEPLKQVADFITLTNNEEGVRHVVETYILQA